MKLRKNISKIGALTGSALMASLSVAAPVAANLDDLPQPFIQDGEFNGSLVVGEEAQTEDVLGAIDIASSFQAEATSPVSVGGGGQVTVEGGEDLTADVGQFFSGEELGDSDLEGFDDTDVELDDTDYDYEEVVDISDSAMTIATSSIRSFSEDESYEQDAFMELAEGEVAYKVTFDDPVETDPGAANGDAWDADDMDISFAGSTLEVQDFDGTDEITVRTASEYTLEVGDSVDVDGHTITLERVGESSVLVDVDGQQKAIQYGSDNSDREATFEDADDFEVEVDSAFYEEGADDNLAVLNLGGSITESYEDGEALDIFGGTDDDDDATWVWDIQNDGGDDLQSIGVRLNHNYEQVGSEEADERNAIPLSEGLEFPNNRAEITFDGFEEQAMTEYDSFDIGFDESTDKSNVENSDDLPDSLDGASKSFLTFSTDEDNLEVGSSLEGGSSFEEISLTWTEESDLATDQEAVLHVFGDDGDDEYYLGQTADFNTAATGSGFDGATQNVGELDLVLDDEEISIDLSSDDLGVAGSLDSLEGNEASNAVSAGVYEFALIVSGSNFDEDHHFGVHVSDSGDMAYFGSDQDEADSSDYLLQDDAETLFSSSPQTFEVGHTDDEPRRTPYGITFDDIEGNLDGDEVSYEVPAQGHEARVLISSQDTQVSSGSSDSDAVEVNRIPVGLGVLDSDVVSNGEITGEGPMVVVGGPYANTAASALLDNPSSSEIETMFSPGQATIRMFDEPEALLVAGYNPEDTVGASLVVADYQDYSEQLTGDEVELVFDGSEDIEFQSPSMNASQ